jgi:hypothetical protein
MMANHIKTASLSPIWEKIREDFSISPSKALRNGIALELALRYPDFPRNELEEMLYADSILPAFKAQLVKRITDVTK